MMAQLPSGWTVLTYSTGEIFLGIYMSGYDFELLNESKAWYELRTSGPDSTVVSPSESP